MAPMMRPLGEHEIGRVHEWLRSLEMPVNRLLHRDYADGVLVAQILKKLFPRYVEMHNYQRRFSQSLKIINWKALESKVLKRLGIKLTQEQVETLARGEVGVIERLLWLIMRQLASGRTLEHEQRRKSNAVSFKESSKRLERATSEASLLSRHQSLRSECSSEKLDGVTTNTTLHTLHTLNTSAASDFHSTVPNPAASPKPSSQCNVLERTLNEFRSKIETLEELFKKRDDDIQILLERERVSAAESTELKKLFGSLKSKVALNSDAA